jgi:Tfp pilus assembly protein PilO
MRTCVGLTISLGMAYYALNYHIKPLQEERAGLEEELQSKGVPAYVPAPEEDNELGELKLKAEAVSESLEKQRQLVADAIDPQAVPSPDEEGRVVGEFDSLPFEAGLDLLNRMRLRRETVAGSLMASDYEYAAAGRFEQVHAFLNAVSGFPRLCRLRALSIRTPDACEDAEAASGGAVEARAGGHLRGKSVLRIEFQLTLYFMGREGR